MKAGEELWPGHGNDGAPTAFARPTYDKAAGGTKLAAALVRLGAESYGPGPSSWSYSQPSII